MIKVFIASDHAGIELKSEVVRLLQNQNWLTGTQREVHDLGPKTTDSVDYPDYADLVCKKIHGFNTISTDGKVSYPKEIGILICGSGQGMCMRANKYQHIRAALCYSKDITKLSREHNDANVICLGARFTDIKNVTEFLELFMTTEFLGGRHGQRVNKISGPT